VVEVDVGHVEHDSQPLEALGDMARQVVRVILDRAARYGRLHVEQVREVDEIERLMQAELSVVLQKAGRAEKLALFDMDGVLLRDRYVLCLARRTNRADELAEFLDHPSMPPEQRTRRIAGLFAGVPREAFEQTARAIPLMPGAAETVIALRRAGYRVGILTDSYRGAAETVRRRVFADFSLAHVMRFRRGVATGELTPSPAMQHPHGCPHHSVCKFNALLHVTEKMGLAAEQVLAVGDGENDLCLLRAAGRSVAFQPKTPEVARAAHCVLHSDLTGVLRVLNEKALASA